MDRGYITEPRHEKNQQLCGCTTGGRLCYAAEKNRLETKIFLFSCNIAKKENVVLRSGISTSNPS